VSNSNHTTAAPGRRRALSPVMVAWILVLIVIGAIVGWLQLTYDNDSSPVVADRDNATNNTPSDDKAVFIGSADDNSYPEVLSPEDMVGQDIASNEETSLTRDATQNNQSIDQSTPPAAADAPPQATSSFRPTRDMDADAALTQLAEDVNTSSPTQSPQSPQSTVNKTAAGTIKVQPATKVTLDPAPFPVLIEQSPHGPLPAIGPGNIQPWQAYARPYETNTDRPRISIVVTGLGLNRKHSTRAITDLPGEVTLAFSPYGRDLQDILNLGRTHGHEALLMVPTEPLNYPENDPGPHTLISHYSPRENLKRLHWIMGRVTGYVGVINDMGSKFTASTEAVAPFLEDLKKRGLLFMDARASRYSVAAKTARKIGVPRTINNRYLDNTPSSDELQKRLGELENIAKTYGAAVGIARTYPISIEEISAWAQTLDAKGFDLVPLSANANRQPVR